MSRIDDGVEGGRLDIGEHQLPRAGALRLRGFTRPCCTTRKSTELKRRSHRFGPVQFHELGIEQQAVGVH